MESYYSKSITDCIQREQVRPHLLYSGVGIFISYASSMALRMAKSLDGLARQFVHLWFPED